MLNNFKVRWDFNISYSLAGLICSRYSADVLEFKFLYVRGKCSSGLTSFVKDAINNLL